MEKIDYRLKYKSIYQPKLGKVEFLLIPPVEIPDDRWDRESEYITRLRGCGFSVIYALPIL